jgi:hypothetical protein
MASQLDTLIASVAVTAGREGRPALVAAATAAAASLKPKDLAKLPGRQHNQISPATADAMDLQSTWHRHWQEAIAEILVQSKAPGLPPLLELWDLETDAAQDLILVRLLRLAADGIEPAHILTRVKSRLTTLHHTKVRASVQQVLNWSFTHPKALELLKSISKTPLSNGQPLAQQLRQLTSH